MNCAEQCVQVIRNFPPPFMILQLMTTVIVLMAVGYFLATYRKNK